MGNVGDYLAVLVVGSSKMCYNLYVNFCESIII